MKKHLKKYLAVLSATAAAALCLSACGGEHTNPNAHSHTYADGWTYDETYHWHAATCEHTEEQGGKVKHNFSVEVTKEATCEEEGEAIYACSCGYSYVGEIPALGHDLVLVPQVDAGCETDGKTEHFACSRCDYEEPYSIILKTNVHIYSTQSWAFDDSTHWRPCLGGCDRKGPGTEAEHDLVDGVCTVCGYSEAESEFRFETVGNSVYLAGLNEAGRGLEKLEIPATYRGKTVTGIKDGAFMGVTSFSEVVLPEGLTSIGAMAFENCTSLTKIQLPAGVTSIGREAFYGCTALETAELSARLTEIGYAAFAGCSVLDGVVLPAGLTAINAYAFDGCAALSAIELPAGLVTLGDQAFANCTALHTIEIPAKIGKINDNTFLNCSNLASVTLPAGLTSIGVQAFAYCTSLTEIHLPSGIGAIGQSAFKGSGLKHVSVPESVTSVGSYAFMACASLETASLSQNIDYHFGGLFADCPALTALTVPFIGSHVNKSEAVVTEFGYLFGITAPATNASAYTKVGNYYIPNALVSVTVLGGTVVEHAFDNCSHLETVYVTTDVVLETIEFNNFTARIVLSGKPEVSLTLPSSAYVNETVAVSYTATLGSDVEITVKKGEAVAVAGEDYTLGGDRTQITFLTEGTFTVTVRASIGEEFDEASASVEVALPGPELTDVSLDKTSVSEGDSIVLSYTAGQDTVVSITVKKGDTEAAAEDYSYDETTKTFTFNEVGTYTITVTGSRNGKTVDKTFTVSVADLTIEAPVIALSVGANSVEEGSSVTFAATVTYDERDAKSTETYEVFVKEGSDFVNAGESVYEWIGEAGAYTGFKPLLAGTYQIKLTVNSERGQTASETVTVTATVAQIELAWTTAADSNGWLRFTNEGGNIAYAVTGYTGGYEVSYTTDDANATANAATSGTAVAVSTTANNTVNVTVTYTHKTDGSVVKTITMPVSFVSNLASAPVLGADPFGGTYGTLIPSTGLMLYFDVTDQNGNSLAYSDISYEVAATDLKLADGSALTAVVISNVYNMTEYPFILVQNFENNTATGTVTVKLTATSNGETAVATKVFKVEPLANDGAGKTNVTGMNDYADKVFDRGDLDLDIIMDFDQRQNAVISKEGIIIHREWGSGTMFAVVTHGVDNFALEFDYTVMQRIGDSNKASFAVNFRTGSWNGYSGSQNAFYAENNSTTIDAGYWGAGDMNWGTGAPAVIGKAYHVRFTHTVENSTAKFVWEWSEDAGETYTEWMSYTIATASTDADMGAPVHALQFNYEDGCIRFGGVTLTNL